MAHVLVVDDEPKHGKVVAQMLELDGHRVERVDGGRDALVRLASGAQDVVVTDLRMPEVDGLAVLRAARAMPVPPEVVVITAHGSAESAVEAMKAGAADYILKPFAMDELRMRVSRLASQRTEARRGARLLERITPNLVAASQGMRTVLEAAERVAPTDATVLLLGESGTGKSQLARWIHYHSARSGGPLVEVHCAALPETLLEGELFGHEKGAFTGATARRAGHLAAADGGTLFLDEIGEISPATQVKLLRFLQDHSFVPLGASAERTVDVRVIAATNRDLQAAVQGGAFREDLFYRLNVFTVEVPPLRARSDDILPIAEGLLAARGLPPEKLATSAREALRLRGWPGNVRELENALERALIFAGDHEVIAEHLGAGRAGASTRRIAAELVGQGFVLDDFVRELVLASLERAGGSKTVAATLLGVTRRRMYSLLASSERGSQEDPAEEP
jgi:DNA-binding NtrC family response regulator